VKPATLTLGGELVVGQLPVLVADELEEAFILSPGRKKEQRYARRIGPHTVAIPRGGHAAVRDVVEKKHGIPVPKYGEPGFSDQRAKGDALALRRPFDLPLRPFQADAVERIERERQGLIYLACAGGKTRTSLAIAARLRRKTLVVMDKVSLVDQWIKSAAPYFRCSRVADGDHDWSGDFVVGCSDSALPDLAADPAIASRFGLVIHDECHHALAQKHRDIYEHMPAAWRIGLTATAEFRSYSYDVIRWIFGRTQVAKTARELIAEGVLQEGKLFVHYTGFRYDDPHPDRDSTRRMEQALIRDPARNRAITTLLARESSLGQTIAVVADRLEYCDILAQLFRGLGVPHVHVLTSQVSPARRDHALDKARRTPGTILIATSLFDEGIDIPELDQLANVFPQRSERQTQQRASRVIRNHEGRVKIVREFVDRQEPLLNDRFRARLPVYEEIGLKMIVQPLEQHLSVVRRAG